MAAAHGRWRPTSILPVRTPQSTPPPPAWGGLWRKSGPERSVSGSGAAEQGSRQVPIRPGGRQRVCERLGDLAVGVARTPPVPDRAGTFLPGRQVGAEHLDHRHRPVAELLVEAPYDGGGEQLELGGPRGRVGAHHQPPVGEGLRGAVLGDVRADQLGPASEDALDPEVEGPAVVGDQSAQGAVERLRIAVIGVGPADMASGGAQVSTLALGVAPWESTWRSPGSGHEPARVRHRRAASLGIRRSRPGSRLAPRHCSRTTSPLATR